MFFVDKLIAMGAPHRAVRSAPRDRGRPEPAARRLMTSPDIRAGMAMLLAAVCAKGVSTINNADQIERGYERIDERLNALGARITRVPERTRQRLIVKSLPGGEPGHHFGAAAVLVCFHDLPDKIERGPSRRARATAEPRAANSPSN